MDESTLIKDGISSLDSKLWEVVIALTGLAGLASWIAKISTKKLTKMSVFELIGEVAFSITVGVSIFLYMMSKDYGQLLAVAIGTLSSHQATRIVGICSNLVTAYADKMMPKKLEPIEIVAKDYGVSAAELTDFLSTMLIKKV